MSFCSQCGVELRTGAQNFAVKNVGKGSVKADMLGILSAGVILILLALTYIRHPVSPFVLLSYFQNIVAQRVFIKPPLPVFNFAIFFLYTAGVGGIVLAGLRIVLQRSVKNALRDLFGGFFSFVCAFLSTNYAQDVFDGQTTAAYFVVAIGLFVVINSLLHFTFPENQ